LTPSTTLAPDALTPGDVIQIKYRIWPPASAHAVREAQKDVADRWIRAIVVACEPATWPLVRLADGQATEVRPFMTWRLEARGSRPAVDAAA